MSGRHSTPLEVASVLARHAPRNISSILEPAVGNGVLLRPLIERLRNSAKKIICVDSDPKALSYVKTELSSSLGRSLQLVLGDFLRWSSHPSGGKNKSFDCVLMNPPFSGRKDTLVRLELDWPSDSILKRVGYVPIEVAFVVRGAKLLKEGGRLLAIVPSSLVSSSRTSWIRRYLLSIGCVRFIHELPRFTFKEVEARVYLFVFEKGTPQAALTLCNHDLYKPEKLIVEKSKISNEARFDFSFHQARLWLDSVRRRFPSLGWANLRSVASLYRGSEESPGGPKCAIHTCDWRNGFWDSGIRRAELKKGNGERFVKHGDLLIRRVGRGCAKSIGPILGHLNHACSDCVYLIRPMESLDSSQLLFLLRTLIAGAQGALLVERGTGAAYITEKALLELPVPVALPSMFQRKFETYVKACGRKDFRAMMSIEGNIRHILSSKTEGEVCEGRLSGRKMCRSSVNNIRAR